MISEEPCQHISVNVTVFCTNITNKNNAQIAGMCLIHTPCTQLIEIIPIVLIICQNVPLKCKILQIFKNVSRFLYLPVFMTNIKQNKFGCMFWNL